MTIDRLRPIASLASLVALLAVAAGCGRESVAKAEAAEPPPAAAVPLPNGRDSYKFAVHGDFGNGSKEQYDLGARMKTVHDGFKFEHIFLVGDNLYGSDRPQDYKTKFELPYKPLLDAGVKFYASLGNHDSREQKDYKLFNMGGKLYYAFSPKPDIKFFVLESTYPEPEQIKWLEDELKGSGSKWKIAVFHHPLYSSGGRHGSDTQLRAVLEPLFVKYNVSVVMQGHDHFYERTKPQQGITYFVVGSGGMLRRGNIDRNSGLTAKGFDTDLAFLAAEIEGDTLTFNTIARPGTVIDSGTIKPRQ